MPLRDETAGPPSPAGDPRGAASDALFSDLIQPFSRRGVDLSLDRLQAALADLGHPERRFAAVQVAGTNGKGSICTLVHQALRAAGIRAGLYTSPHLVSWTERIRLGDDPIEAVTLREHLESASVVAARHNLTPFELVTAAAFLAFAAAGLELVVLEVGLGGRLDATTCHPDRRVIGLASIGLDHAEFLGPDGASIAREKAGVLQPGALAFSAEQSPEVRAVLDAEARRLGADLRWLAPLDRQQWELGLAGEVQTRNAAVALGMLRALAEQGWPIPEAAIRRGFARARWPGRLQPLHWRGLPLLVDGAHNRPAAEWLRAELDRAGPRHGLQPGPRRWVLGILASKQGPEILEALLAPGDQAWIVPVPDHSSWSVPDLAAAVSPELARQIQARSSLDAALLAAGEPGERPLPLPAPNPVLVAGSLYLIGHLLGLIAAE